VLVIALAGRLALGALLTSVVCAPAALCWQCCVVLQVGSGLQFAIVQWMQQNTADRQQGIQAANHDISEAAPSSHSYHLLVLAHLHCCSGTQLGRPCTEPVGKPVIMFSSRAWSMKTSVYILTPAAVSAIYTSGLWRGTPSSWWGLLNLVMHVQPLCSL